LSADKRNGGGTEQRTAIRYGEKNFGRGRAVQWSSYGLDGRCGERPDGRLDDSGLAQSGMVGPQSRS